MKHLTLYVMLLFFIATTITVNAQHPTGSRPELFSNYPGKIACTEAELNKVFAATTDQQINISFSDNFLFSGVITSNVVKYSNLQTVVIRSAVFSNAIFVLSKITDENGGINYVGRIINQKYFDGYELKKDEAGNYQLIKIETTRVIQDCSHN